MSASKKKQLHSESTEKLTERQILEQKEAKKVKLYSIGFVVVLVALIAVAVWAGVSRSVAASGVHERNTIAATVGEHQLSNAELNYYYIDYINNYSNNYGSYLSLFGLNTSEALDKQIYNQETGETWADNFMKQAAESAKTVYALSDAAEAEGFTLPEDSQTQVTLLKNNLNAYATMYGYSDADAFLKAQYGNGASVESYLDYYSRNLLASAYQAAHQESLTYTQEQIREADSKDAAKYSSYSYAQYYIPVAKYLPEGTTSEDGTTTYTAAERTEAVAAAKEAIAPLTEATSLDELNAAIAAMDINEGTEASATVYTNQASSAINTYLSGWVTDSARKAGDITCVEVPSTVKDENDNDLETVSAFYVVLYNGVNDNNIEMVNVRHILVSFDGDKNEDGTYTDGAKEATREKAEDLLNQWKSGDATEESFAELANANSTDTGSNTNGGLYEDVYPGQMVDTFNDWCFDTDRKAGDTGIVETTYGYHVMYFVGTSGQTYRDYQIENDLRTADMNTWFDNLAESYTVTMGNTSYMRKGIVLSGK